MNELHREVEEKVYGLLARQAPVASDLRLVITALHISADLERMGDLAEHVAKTALRRHPALAVPAELRRCSSDMADVADRIAGKISTVLASRDAAARGRAGARRRRHGRAAQGPLRGACSAPPGRTGSSPPSTAPCSGRFYERYADHAVNAGRHMYFLVTGEQLD